MIISEKYIEYLMIKKLEKLKWRININNNPDVFMQSPKHNWEKINLKGLLPDFILYSYNQPIAIIEVKKPYSIEKDWEEQTREYAKRLRARFIIFYDGIEFWIQDVKTDKILPYNDMVSKKVLNNWKIDKTVSFKKYWKNNLTEKQYIFNKEWEQYRKRKRR